MRVFRDYAINCSFAIFLAAKMHYTLQISAVEDKRTYEVVDIHIVFLNVLSKVSRYVSRAARLGKVVSSVLYRSRCAFHILEYVRLFSYSAESDYWYLDGIVAIPNHFQRNGFYRGTAHTAVVIE